MKYLFFVLFCYSFCCQGQSIIPNPDQLYKDFAQAYTDLDAEQVAKLYIPTAELLNLYDNSSPNSLKGQQEIQKYFADFFKRVQGSNKKLQITFKIISRKQEKETILDNGFYRLEIITPQQPSEFYFGQFSTVLVQENQVWKFRTDASASAQFIAYENAITSSIPQRDEVLYAGFYDDLLGDYLTQDNQLIVIGRSQTRLYAFWEATQQYRGLSKISAMNWTSGNTLISKEITQTYKFFNDRIEVYAQDKLVTTAYKKALYQTQKVSYLNSQNIRLGATLFIPEKPNGKAMVLVHGSGGQDRNGYASIIRLLADVLAREGVTVLTYDKQGVGQSAGDYTTEGFDELAGDALAGIAFLRSRTDLQLKAVGLAGSSQAGWIIAKAIEKDKKAVDYALTIGSAGCGCSVMEQNLYNTEVLMQCTKQFSKTQISNALTQQRLFFDYVLTKKNAKQLDNFTKKVEKDTTLRDWLFPVSSQIDLASRNQWFTTLALPYNPMAVWKEFDKPILMIFSQFDDSTPTQTVVERIKTINNSNIQITVLNQAQHIGLETSELCKNDIAELSKFHKDFFKKIREWLNKLQEN